MSSYELFSLAAGLRQQATACERVRVDVDRVWSGLDHLLDRLVASHEPAVWQSATADDSRLRLHHQRSHLIRLRYTIEQIARRLQARADELHTDAGQVESAAEMAREQEIQEFTIYINSFL